MQIGVKAQLAVKWKNGTWTYYRVAKYRKFEALVKYFTNLDNFCFGILYQWSKEEGRGSQIGYFSKKEDRFYK